MIECRRETPPAAAVAALFNASGIRRPTGDLARMEVMLAQASLVFSAWEDGALVGLCRALTDFSYCCYISDLAVDKAHQQQGIGRALIGHVQRTLGDQVSLILAVGPRGAWLLLEARFRAGAGCLYHSPGPVG